MPFLMNMIKSTSSPYYEKSGAQMYRSTSKKNVYATGNSSTAKPTAQAPAKSYSAIVDNEESGEGVSMEFVKSDISTSVEIFEEKDTKSGIELDFNSDSILNGIILSEILGKPLSKRKSRW